MALKRFIHAEMFTSEDFNALSFQARLLWIGIFGCVADDEGRGKAGVGFLKASIFPFDPFRLDQVSGWLAEVAERGMVIIYQDKDGRKLFQIPSWRTWQRPKYVKASKFPGINDKANSGQNGPNPATGRVGLGRVGLGSTPYIPRKRGTESTPSPGRKTRSQRKAERAQTHDEFGHIRWCEHRGIGKEPDPECLRCQAVAEEVSSGGV